MKSADTATPAHSRRDGDRLPRLVGRRTARQAAVDVLALFVMTASAIIGFGPVFGGTSYLTAGIGGALVGALVGVLAAALRLGAVTTVLAAAIGYVFFGGALAASATTVAGVVPTIDTLGLLGSGIFVSWKQLLTVQPPAAAFGAVLVVPYLSALLVMLIGTTIALRTRRFAIALLPVAALLVLVILFGTHAAAVPVVQGLVASGVAIAWYAWRRADAVRAGSEDLAGASEPGVRRQIRRRRFGSFAALGVAAVIITVLSAMALASTPTRHVLRDAITPPLDLHNLATPLASFRSYIRDDKKTVLFTVTGLPDGARIRLATLDSYDGIVFSMSAGSNAGSGAFYPVGSSITQSVRGTDATVSFSIDKLRGAWLPGVGYARSVQFAGANASALHRALAYNAATGSAVQLGGIEPGEDYTLATVVPRAVSDAQLKTQGAASVAMPQLTGVPDVVGSTSTKDAAGASSVLAKARALETALSHDGFFSNGLVGQAPSRAGHTAERISTLLSATQMVGDDEQYSVAMALMARQLGLPARVVMGFYPDSSAAKAKTIAITGADAHAWVEIDFAHAGWVTFDPTPPKNQVPQAQAPKPKSIPKAQVMQPPLPPKAPVELPPQNVPGQTGSKHHTPTVSILPAVLVGAGIGLLGLLVLLTPAVMIGVLKLRRRRDRKGAPEPADRLSGGWDEIIDTAVDLGTPVNNGSTRREDAAALALTYPASGVLALAQRADAGVFGPIEPSEREIDAAWLEVEQVIEEMTTASGRFGRLKRRLSIRSLLRRHTRTRTHEQPHENGHKRGRSA
ncbi:MAG TPA: transglutaminaseTgpA domain-containing protein [Microbacteriaceae bacterium]